MTAGGNLALQRCHPCSKPNYKTNCCHGTTKSEQREPSDTQKLHLSSDLQLKYFYVS